MGGMSTATLPPQTPLQPPAERRAPITAGLAAAAQAVVASLGLVAAPVVAVWVLTSGTQTTWPQAVRVAGAVWLLAQHTGLSVTGGHVGLVPLGLTVVPLLACYHAARRLSRTLDPAWADQGTARSREPVLPPRRALAAFLAGYCALAVAISFLAAGPGLHPVTAQALAGSLVVSGVGAAAGAGAHRFGTVRAAVRALAERAPLPGLVRRALAPAATALGVLATAATVLLAITLAVQHADVVTVQRALGAGLGGGLVLVAAQLALLPNAVLFAAAFVCGPGFSVGAGTSVTPSASVLGPLPALPVLAALPAPQAFAPALLAVLAVPFLAGAVAGWQVLRRSDGSRSVAALQCVLVAVLCGAAVGVAGWLAGGPAGPGRLAVVGPSPLAWSAVLAAEVLAGGLLVQGLRQVVALVARKVAAAGR